MTSLSRPRRRVVRRAFAWSTLAAFACALTSATHASAQSSLADGNGDGMNTRLFNAAVDSKGFFAVNGTDVLGKKDWAVGLVLDAGFGLLRLRDRNSANGVLRTDRNLIDTQGHGTLFASWSPFQSFTIGLGLPVDLVSGKPQSLGGTAPEPVGPTAPIGITPENKTDVSAFFTGNYQLNAKLRMLRVEDDFIGMAAIVVVELPASGAARRGYAADPGPTFTPMLAIEKRFGSLRRFRVGLNGGVTLVSGEGSQVGDLAAASQGGVLKHGSLAKAGFAMSYRIFDDVDLVAETYASKLLSYSGGRHADTSAEAVGGLKVFVERNSYLLIGGGAGYLKGYQAATGRAFLGFIFEPSIGDRDGDGLKDDVDQCPDQPEDRDGFQDEDGCPDPDNDQDGILDRDDACPNDPETKNGIADDDGCPDGIDGDRDHDGIPDSKDKCPDEPEDKDGFQDEDGCPDPDNDQDGILDKVDACPDQPEDKDGFQDQDGCPDPDNDHDGILDREDKCPNDPETYNGFEDEDGCPDKGRVYIEEGQIKILDKIQFDYNSAAIRADSLPIVDAVAATLRGNAQITMVEVEGHADERGDDRYNLRLTQERVNSVVHALIQRGIDRSRLRAKGYGEYCPLEVGHNDAAWDKNRRVEFRITKTKDGPTNIPLGCAEAAGKGVKPDPVP